MNKYTVPLMTFVCLCLALAPTGCNKQHKLPTTGGVSGQPAVDELHEALVGQDEAQRQFALLYITKFDLDGYKKDLAQLAKTDSVAAVTYCAVYQDAQPALDWYRKQPQDSRTSQLLGAVYGLGCAHTLPQEMWDELLESCTAEETEELLWALAQLDYEPGGPVLLNAAVVEKITAAAGGAAGLRQRAACDALLGTRDGRTIDWAQYLIGANQLQLSNIQWAALNRWASAEIWSRLFKPLPDEASRANLLSAAAAVAPAGVTLPWSEAECAARKLAPEYAAYGLTAGKSGNVATLLKQLLTPAPAPKQDKAATDGADAEADQPPAVDSAKLEQAVRLLQYACQRQDQTVMAAALEQCPELDDIALSAVLSTLERYTPADKHATVPTEEQLKALIDLAHPVAAYWLLYGWADRKPVIASRMAALVRVTPNPESPLLVYAYRLHQAQIVLGDNAGAA